MINVNSVYKTFTKDKIVLNGVDLKCSAGNIYTLIGKNGAGKSTLINSLAGLISINSGSIKIMDEVVSPNRRSSLQKVGFVFDENSLIGKFTAKEQLEFAAYLHKIKNAKKRITQLMELLELPSDNSKYIETYSSGMKSKIAICCALIHSPDILILDEPFRGLDIPITNKLFGYLKEYVKNDKCILITTHQIDIISELSNYILILKEGKIQGHFSYDEVIKECSVYSDSRNPLGVYLENLLSS